MKFTIYYLNNRMVDKGDIPKNATLVKTLKTTTKWAGIIHKIYEKYYK